MGSNPDNSTGSDVTVKNVVKDVHSKTGCCGGIYSPVSNQLAVR